MADLISLLKATVRKLASSQPLDVSIVDGTGAQITSFGGTGGTSSQDGSVGTPGSTQGTVGMGLYEAAPTSVADGKVGMLGMTTDRKLKISGSFSATPATAGTSSLANVAENTSSVTLLASNANRLSFTVYNDSDGILNVKLGAAASATSHTRSLLPRDKFCTADLGVNWTGIIDGIWLTAPGTAGHDSARVTELTA